MRLHLGYEMVYEYPQPTPMIVGLHIHHSRVSDIVLPDHLVTDPPVPITTCRDGFGNWCSRLVAPPGSMRLSADALIEDSGEPDPVVPAAEQHAVEDLPEQTLDFLRGSRYCETDRLCQMAWDLFGDEPSGWARVQTICDFVHRHVTFDYMRARATRTATETLEERVGVCRDFTHLAIALCRCMNIPARYCTGYLSDIAVPPPYGPMDFAAWMEVYLGGRWYTFDPRNNVPRIGRVLIARGRDAADVAIATTFGTCTLTRFKVWADEVAPSAVEKLCAHGERNGDRRKVVHRAVAVR